MTTPEAQQVHIQTLYAKIDELSEDCAEQHKQGLEAIREVHRRIDDFTKIMIQMSEINKDLQSLIAHQKAVESTLKTLEARMDIVESAQLAHGATVRNVNKVAWGVSGFVALAIGGAFLKVVGL